MKVSSSNDVTPDEQEVINDFLSESKLQESKKRSDSIPYYKLYSLADRTDYGLMIVGTISAISNGISLPMSTVFFGDMVNAFGMNINIRNIAHAVSKVDCSYNHLIKRKKIIINFLLIREPTFFPPDMCNFFPLPFEFSCNITHMAFPILIPKNCISHQVSLKFVYLGLANGIASLLRKNTHLPCHPSLLIS